MSKSLVEMTAEIVQAQINTREMSNDEIKTALHETFQTLKGLQEAETTGAPVEEGAKPAIAPEKSILKNKVICLECGESFKMLSPKHLKGHGLTPREYRQKHGFKLRQPLCAKSLSERRSASGKKRGLPENLKKSIAARSRKKKASGKK
ncbi:MAG: MucR family transcriptional regulator [Desulfobulbaceae bacterium]